LILLDFVAGLGQSRMENMAKKKIAKKPQTINQQ
jgi:hypothetical protein